MRLAVATLASSLLLMGCTSLPEAASFNPSYAIINTDDTALGRAVDRELDDTPQENGLVLLNQGTDAFVARATLAVSAEKTLDVQYYMFHQDTVGQLFTHHLAQAAERGVRVRILLDDTYGAEEEDTWHSLNQHPNIQIRFFNPFSRSLFSKLEWVTRGGTVTHRMHNKSFTADNKVAIVGGRNIGDEYYAASEELSFADFDVLAYGPIVHEVSDQFDLYWNSGVAYPVEKLLKNKEAIALEETIKSLSDHAINEDSSSYNDALENSDLANQMRDGTIKRFVTEDAKILYDSPHKRDESIPGWRDKLLITQLSPYLLSAKKEINIISPYFVPGDLATNAMCDAQKRGVTVKILTNSLASNDVTAVHGGYRKYRKTLLRCGVTIYELNEQIKKQDQRRFRWLKNVSKSSLHAKIMAYDHEVMFVGSFNFDQLSMYRNNEVGILFKQREVVGGAMEVFDKRFEEMAFRLELTNDSSGREKIVWHGYKDGKRVTYDKEPYASGWLKFLSGLYGVLPIEKFL